MANYQGLNCIMPEITMMASNEKNPIHEQHIYDYFTVTEKFVRIAVPQLFMDCMAQFEERLIVEFETYKTNFLIRIIRLKKSRILTQPVIAKIVPDTKYPIYMKHTSHKKNRRADILPTIFSRANNHIYSILLAANHPLKQVSVSSCLLLQNSHNLQKTP